MVPHTVTSFAAVPWTLYQSVLVFSPPGASCAVHAVPSQCQSTPVTLSTSPPTAHTSRSPLPHTPKSVAVPGVVRRCDAPVVGSKRSTVPPLPTMYTCVGVTPETHQRSPRMAPVSSRFQCVPSKRMAMGPVPSPASAPTA